MDNLIDSLRGTSDSPKDMRIILTQNIFEHRSDKKVRLFECFILSLKSLGPFHPFPLGFRCDWIDSLLHVWPDNNSRVPPQRQASCQHQSAFLLRNVADNILCDGRILPSEQQLWLCQFNRRRLCGRSDRSVSHLLLQVCIHSLIRLFVRSFISPVSPSNRQTVVRVIVQSFASPHSIPKFSLKNLIISEIENHSKILKGLMYAI